jgi:HSP20 family protein
MKRPTLKRSLITAGLLALVGTVGAETYYTHEVAQRLEATGQTPQAEPQAPAYQADPQPSPGHGTWDPWAEMRRMQQRIDQLFEDSWQRMQAEFGGSTLPTGVAAESDVTLEDEDTKYVVTANLPGIEKGNLDVSLDGRLLRISARSQSQEQETADQGQVVHEERYATSVQRAFTLPGPVDASGMHTRFEDGVLTVTIPKAAS